MPNPALCTESLDPAFTIGTFDLYVQPANASEQLIGNIDTGGFQFTPNTLEHRDGKTNSLDALFVLGKDYFINFTTDTINAYNLATLLNEDTINVAEGCKIPFTGSRCVRSYGARLLHFFPCGTRTLEIVFHRAAILSEFTLNFERETPATMAGIIRSLKCESANPNDPFGYAILSGTCPAS